MLSDNPVVERLIEIAPLIVATCHKTKLLEIALTSKTKKVNDLKS